LGINLHLREVFINDLIEALKEWKEEGDLIVLLIDANKNIHKGRLVEGLEDLGLKEVILDRYMTSKDLAPIHQLGLVPIDGIFISGNVEILTGGYLPFGVALSDHRALWIKVKIDLAFGYQF